MAELTLTTKLYLFAIGLLVGAISPTFGIGGGLVTVPLLILFFGFDGNLATATSLGLIIFTTLSGTIAYYIERRIDFKLAAIFMIFAVPGTLLGGYSANYFASIDLEIDILQFIFAAFMMTIAGTKIASLYEEYKAGRKKEVVCDARIPDAETDQQEPPEPAEPFKEVSLRKTNRIKREFMDNRKIKFSYEVVVFPKVLVAFIGGFFGALLGLGGGLIYVPVLTMLMGVPIGIAAATSTFTIFVSSLLPIILRFSFVQWEYVLFLALGTIISASIVPKFICKVQSETLLLGFWIIVAITALRLLINVIFIVF